MTITIEEARKLLPPEYGQVSDEDIQGILDYMHFICDFSIRWHRDHPGETFSDRKKVEPEEPKLNKEWHQANKMPIKATLDQKIKRHIDHVAHCKCRPMPNSIKVEIQKRIGK